ncbi:HTH_Tnp_Tc3_2 domain-containing protein [Trichonephila clavipes]|nr:HTH_Tnp_Tc3_2 domain-containing protein [Trichonephila clavipes]
MFGKLVNPEIVRNALGKLKYHGKVPQRKPYISKANRQTRLTFAKMYVRQPTEYWEDVIFVDESKYNIFGSDSKQKVWRKSNTAMHVKNLRFSVKYVGGLVRGNKYVPSGFHHMWVCLRTKLVMSWLVGDVINFNPSSTVLTHSEIYSFQKHKMNLTWRNPSAHHWYAAKSPGLSIQCRSSKAHQGRGSQVV